MTEPKQVNLLADLGSSRTRHLGFTISRKRILSESLKGHNSHSAINKLLIVMLFILMQAGSVLFAQEFEVRGKVTNVDDGSALIGATVLEKGTTNGVATDLNGEFRLRVKRGTVLLVSYIGYANQEVTVTDQRYLNIALKMQAKFMKEVEVVGIG